MSARASATLPPKRIYILVVFAIAVGSAVLMWTYRLYSGIALVFALSWVGLLTGFTWLMVTRAGRLDSIVHSRTDALEAKNRQLTTLLEQISAFHRISYEMNQKLELREITRAFTGRIYKTFPEINGVWLWLDPQRIHRDLGRTRGSRDGPVVLKLAAQCGRDFGMPDEMKELRPGHPLVSACFEGGSMSVAKDLRRRAASLGWEWLAVSPMVSFAVVPLRLGKALLGMLGIFSKQTLSAEFLRQVNLSVNQFTVALEKARLLRHMRRRADELAAVNEELRQLDDMKDWFISSVSHELRTPLTSIRSFSEILENYDALKEGERREFAGIIREESQRLSEMIDEMLNLAKVAQGKASSHPARFDVGPLLVRVCRLFSQQAEERGIEFGLGVPDNAPLVFANEMGVARVLNNLVGNAFKFTHDGGKIEVLARCDTPEAVTVLVRDNGVGIAYKDQEKIFDRFSQVANQLTAKTPGTGIGLAICKELVGHWHGNLRVESEPGKGSTFWFTLPVAG